MGRDRRKLHFGWHHRKPQSLGGENTDRNKSYVSVLRHRAWHTLFENMDPYEIAKVINDIWLDRDYILVVHKKEVTHPARGRHITPQQPA